MVEPPAEVIPGNDDGSVCPVRALTNGIHDGRNPGGSRVCAAAWVIRSRACGSYPADGRQLLVRDVGYDLRARSFNDDFRVGVGPVGSAAGEVIHCTRGLAHVLDRIRSRPDIPGRGCVILPT